MTEEHRSVTELQNHAVSFLWWIGYLSSNHDEAIKLRISCNPQTLNQLSNTIWLPHCALTELSPLPVTDTDLSNTSKRSKTRKQPHHVTDSADNNNNYHSLVLDVSLTVTRQDSDKKSQSWLYLDCEDATIESLPEHRHSLGTIQL